MKIRIIIAALALVAFLPVPGKCDGLSAVLMPNTTSHVNANIGFGVGLDVVPFQIAGRRFSLVCDYVGRQDRHELISQDREKGHDTEVTAATFKWVPALGASVHLFGNTSAGVDFQFARGRFSRPSVVLRFAL